MGLTAVLEAIGALLAPIFREVLPVLVDIWREPEEAQTIESSEEQREISDEVNREWDRIEAEYALPPDYPAV